MPHFPEGDGRAPWRATVLTLFPEMFPGPLGLSSQGRLWRLASGRSALSRFGSSGWDASEQSTTHPQAEGRHGHARRCLGDCHRSRAD